MANKLPTWENWDEGYDGHDGTLDYLMGALDTGVIEALTIGPQVARDAVTVGYSVSVRRDGDGWDTYYGTDLGNVIARAVMQGPQVMPSLRQQLAEWNKPKSVNEAVTTLEVADAKTLAPLYGVHYKFNSEGVKQLRNEEW